MKIPFSTFLTLLILSTTLNGQDQTIVLSAAPKVLPTDSSIDKLVFTRDAAAKVITQVFPQTEASDNASYVVHVLKHDDQGGQEWDGWYVYHASWKKDSPTVLERLWDGNYKKHFTSNRIFGSQVVRLAYAHVNVRGFIVQSPEEGDIVAIKKQLGLEKSVANDETIRKFLRGDATPDFIVKSDRGASYLCRKEVFGESTRSVCLESKSTSLVNIRYEVKVAKKVPQPTKDFEGLLGTVFGTATAGGNEVRIQATSLTAYGGGPLPLRYVPSDLEIRALLQLENADGKMEAKELAKMTFDNEQKYRWGLSFAVPMTSLDELKYVSKEGQESGFQPETVNKQRVYAMLSVYPFAPVDTKRPFLRINPGFMAGLAISGKALNQQLYGVTVGLWRLEAFWGHKVTRTERPNTGDGGKREYDVSSRSTFGLMLPVNTVVDLFKPKK